MKDTIADEASLGACSCSSPLNCRRVDVESALAELTPRIRALSSLYSGGNYQRQQDLFQEGAFGLVKAADRFDSTKGAKFSTFANRYIRGRMQNFLRGEAKHWPCASMNDHSWRVEIEEDVEDDWLPVTAAQALQAVDDLLFQVELRLIRQPIQCLQRGFTVKQRRILSLRFRDGMAPCQIAALLRISPARVSQVLSETVAKLRCAFMAV
jgi:RNA polymerase sporulation-specific sigma factor